MTKSPCDVGDTDHQIARLQTHVKSLTNRLDVLEGITSLSGADTKTICNYILASIVSLTDSEYGFYGFINDAETEMIIHSWSGEAMKDCSIVDKPQHFTVSKAGVWAEAIRRREPLVLNDYTLPHDAKRGLPKGHVSLTNMLVVPDITNGKVTAVAAVANRVDDYDQHQVDRIRSLLGSIRAVTDAKRAEEALMASESRYRALFQTQAHGAYLQRADGRFVDVNAAALEIFGVTRHEFLSRCWDDQIWALIDEDGALVGLQDSPALVALRTALPVSGRVLGVRNERSARTVWVEMYAVPEFRYGESAPFRVVVTMQDITSRRQTAAALRERETLFASLVENGVALITLTDVEGKVQYMSPQCSDVLGYPPEAFHGHKFPDIIHPEDRERCAQALEEAMRGRDVDGFEYRILDQEGQVRWISHSARLIVVDGRRVGLQYVVTNITARKQEEEARAQLQAQLSQAQRIEAVGQLAGGVAHDFNNMLTVIQGNAEFALEDMKAADPLYEYLTEITGAARRSAEITRQLLAFARRQPITPQVLDLTDTVQGLLKMLRRLIGEDIRLSWCPAMGLWRVRMDPAQIDQILVNLCLNARDAIGGVGKIDIATQNVLLDESARLSHAGGVSLAGEYVCLSVADNGCGMDTDALERIFEPFYTTKPVGQGTGLGLATVYGIVRQNDGAIHVDSAPGKGTVFSVYLPRHMAVEKHAISERGKEDIGAKGETILVVEDERSILRMMVSTLKRLGYRVLPASSPQEAIVIAKSHVGNIHLVITDVVMPQMSGRDLVQCLEATNPRMLCLYVSGYTADVIANRGVLDEGITFLPKPFTPRSLGLKVRESLDQVQR